MSFHPPAAATSFTGRLFRSVAQSRRNACKRLRLLVGARRLVLQETTTPGDDQVSPGGQCGSLLVPNEYSAIQFALRVGQGGVVSLVVATE